MRCNQCNVLSPFFVRLPQDLPRTLESTCILRGNARYTPPREAIGEDGERGAGQVWGLDGSRERPRDSSKTRKHKAISRLHESTYLFLERGSLFRTRVGRLASLAGRESGETRIGRLAPAETMSVGETGSGDLPHPGHESGDSSLRSDICHSSGRRPEKHTLGSKSWHKNRVVPQDERGVEVKSGLGAWEIF